MKNSWFTKALVVLLAVSMLAGCTTKPAATGSDAEPKQAQTGTAADPEVKSDALALASPTNVHFACGSSGGTMYVYCGGVASVCKKAIKNMDVMVEATGGGGANVEMLKTGEVDMAIVDASQVYEKFYGINLAEGEKTEDYANMRTLIPTYMHHYILFTTTDTGIQTVEQCAGLDIPVGPLGGSGDACQKAVFNTLDIPYTMLSGKWNDCVTDLADGRVKAATVSTGHPSSPITDLETKRDVVYLELTDEQRAKINEVYPYYLDTFIPKGMYRSMTEDYHTVGNWVCLFVTTEMSDEVAYAITKAVMENHDDMLAAHAAAKYTIPENAAQLPLPLHPGAIKYYEEVGIQIPDNLKVG